MQVSPKNSSLFLRRVRFTILFGCTTAFALLVFAGLNLSRGNQIAFIVESAAAISGVFIMVFLRKTRKLDRAQTLLLADIKSMQNNTFQISPDCQRQLIVIGVHSTGLYSLRRTNVLI